jgi:hypothetical protein
MATVQNFVDDTLVLLAVLDPGGSPSSSERTHAETALNRLLANWSAAGVFVPKVTRDAYTLTGAASVTMGPTGTIAVARPLKIKSAAIVVSNIAHALEIVTAEQWAQIRDRSRAGKWAEFLFADYAFPDLTLYLTPTPASGGSLEIFSLKAMSSVALADTLAWPVGYERAVQYALAADLAPSYGRVVSPDIAAAAKSAMDAIAGLNASVLGMPMPAAAPVDAQQQ